MTTPDDNRPTRDPQLTALYHAGERLEPPTELDAMILQRAQPRQMRASERPTRTWAIPVSIAAVLVLSTSLVILLRPAAPPMTPASNVVVAMVPVPDTSRDDAALKAEKPAEMPVLAQKRKEPTVPMVANSAGAIAPSAPVAVARLEESLLRKDAAPLLKKSDAGTSSEANVAVDDFKAKDVPAKSAAVARTLADAPEPLAAPQARPAEAAKAERKKSGLSVAERTGADPPCKFESAGHRLLSADHPKDWQCMKQWAAQGDRGWQIYVGYALLAGTNADGKQRTQGMEMLTAAATQGDANAMRALGDIYSSDAELKNVALAYQWYFLASHGDNELFAMMTKELEPQISGEQCAELKKHAPDLLDKH